MKKVLFFLLALLLAVGLSFAQGAQTKSSGQKSATAAAPTKSSAHKGGKLDINAASKDQLAALPGFSPAIAQKIIDGRPYRAKNDLVRRKIISQTQYEKVTDQIIAHRVKTSATAKKPAAKSGTKQ